jgi:hypothetical protein
MHDATTATGSYLADDRSTVQRTTLLILCADTVNAVVGV